MPHANNGAVAVHIRCGEYCVLTRQPERRDPLWKMVGGEIEDGETPQEAAIREALEEADLDLSHARFSEVMEFPQIRGPRGPYVQYVLEAVVKPELIERHRTGLVDTTDAEGQKHESTAFRLESVLGMKDFMPKHANFLRALSREVQAA